MVLGMDLFGYGYGCFSCTAGEHLNKIVKSQEMGNTNLGPKRFYRIMRNLRIKQFVYPETIIPTECSVRCSACGQLGHNRKNKSCPGHESRIEIEFSDSDDDGGSEDVDGDVV